MTEPAKVAVTKLNESLGFVKDGVLYTNDNGPEWQVIKLELR